MGVQYQPLTESFRELNRMLIEKQAWDADFKLREADRGLKNMITKSQLNSAAQQQQLTAFKIKEQEQLHTPKIIQLSRIVQGGPEQLAEIEANPEAMALLTKTLDDEGVGLQYSPADKTWRHPISNEPVRFSPYDMQFRAPGMFGIIDGHTDSVASIRKSQAMLTEQIQAIDKDIAKARKGQHSKQAVQELTQQRQGIMDKLKAANDFMTPEGLLTYYENKQAQFMKRGAFYHKLGAKDLANQMQKHADQAAASKREVLSQMMKGKGGDAGKHTGDIMVYATKKQHYKGKDYDIGGTRKVRWAPGQGELTLPKGWDFEDPLAVDKRKGDKAGKASFNFLQATKKYAQDVKTEGFMGDVTSEQSKLVRDAMDAAHRNLAKQYKISADADNADIYGQVKEHFALARDQYWMDKLDANENWDVYLPKLKQKFPDKSEKELKKILDEDIEQGIHDLISEVTGGRHAKFVPSKMKRRGQKN